MYTVDLNCDLGEGFGNYRIPLQDEILSYVTSVNIACGFHAGDPSTMRETVLQALDKNVAIGAHPGLQDLVGFGRRNMAISAQEAYDIVVYQIGALQAFVQSEGGVMQHVKPHGALYNMAANNPNLAEAIAKAIYKVNPNLVLFGLAGSEMIKAGKMIGLRVAEEVFSDRTYQQDGTLTPRNLPDALITKSEDAIKQVIRMVKEGKVLTRQGVDFDLNAHTVCIHGDGPHALDFAKQIHHEMKQAKIEVTNRFPF